MEETRGGERERKVTFSQNEKKKMTRGKKTTTRNHQNPEKKQQQSWLKAVVREQLTSKC